MSSISVQDILDKFRSDGMPVTNELSPVPTLVSYRRIFVYTFCLINICLSLSDDANKIKTLNIERA